MDQPDPTARRLLRYAWALGACAVTTVAAVALLPWLDLANIVMLFLLNVVLVALRWGRGPSVLATLLCVAAFDFFCVPPRLTFAVADAQYLVTFAVMLAVGLITGQLTAVLQHQARTAARREERARALYEFARELSGALTTEQVVEIAASRIGRTFGATVEVLPDADAAECARSIPLRTAMRTRGAMKLRFDGAADTLDEDQRRHLDTFAALTAIALERVHYVDVAQRALVRMESERLRNSLLAAVSHDLRTPVAALVGLAESLTLVPPALAPSQAETAQALVDEARRMSRLIDNLLDMARLQSGEVHLRRDWQSIEEVVGSALRAARPALAQRTVVLELDAALPLVEFDATLIERVLYNLLENAGKYTPPDARIVVSARATAEELEVTVSDDGPGIARGQEEAVFEKFVRGERESSTPGVGLGLAISRAIVEAHGGRIRAESGLAGGARLRFSLPLGVPPVLADPMP